MKWEWRGKEDTQDTSGIMLLEFGAGKTSVELSHFSSAHFLAQLIDKEIASAERRGAKNAVYRYSKLGEEITAGT